MYIDVRCQWRPIHAEYRDAFTHCLVDNGSSRLSVNRREGNRRVIVVDECLEHRRLLREKVGRCWPLERDRNPQLGLGAARTLLGGRPERRQIIGQDSVLRPLVVSAQRSVFDCLDCIEQFGRAVRIISAEGPRQ